METDDKGKRPAEAATARPGSFLADVEEGVRILPGKPIPEEAENADDEMSPLEKSIHTANASALRRRNSLLAALDSVRDDLGTIATNLNLVDDADALQVGVRISKIIAQKHVDGAKIIIREKDGATAELVIESTDEGRQDAKST
jgi:hypothetical protein